ncbi:hypothetical protein B566_EDAN014827 [Ephemera danica]|nr:hypothetical protein B566_EDAN014827 [Ephemera danica]
MLMFYTSQQHELLLVAPCMSIKHRSGSEMSNNARIGLPLTKLGEGFYYFQRSAMNWYDAQRYCRQYGLELVSLESSEEQNLLSKYMEFLDMKRFWTSGSDNAKENSFTWTSNGKPIQFTAWNDNEPNNWGNNENCVEAVERGGWVFKWNDGVCTEKIEFICELPTTCWGY